MSGLAAKFGKSDRELINAFRRVLHEFPLEEENLLPFALRYKEFTAILLLDEYTQNSLKLGVLKRWMSDYRLTTSEQRAPCYELRMLQH